MMPKPIVKDVSDRSHKYVENELQKANKRSEVISNRNFMLSSTVSLREHLPKDNNSNGRDNDSKIAGHYFIKEDRECFKC